MLQNIGWAYGIVEKYVLNQFQWPSWAFRVIAILLLMISIVQYLTVYFVVMLADWLQGTNMYTLYSSYGVHVGILFLTGFLSSALFGTFLGIYVDSWGRKFGCLLFCVLEIVINMIEHIPHMPSLMFGRIMGGLSTSLLFSAFESWMVCEHRRRGFPEKLLVETFSIASWSNGIGAISAGFLAQIAADMNGDIGPFQLAIALTVVALVLILFWPENYGSTSCESDEKNGTSTSMAIPSSVSATESVSNSIRASYRVIRESPVILMLGLSQAFFEGAVYSFVFLWVPALLATLEPRTAEDSIDLGNSFSTGLFGLAIPTSLPVGLIFSAFMLAMSLGGMLFGLLSHIFPNNMETLAAFIYAVSACAMVVPVIHFEFWSLLISCLFLEAMVGMFNSCGATLRSKYYPGDSQSSIISVFRLPLNLLVVVGTTIASAAGNSARDLQIVFMAICSFHLIAFGLQIYLMTYEYANGMNKQKKY